MPRVAQSVLPFDCTLCGVLVATTDPVKGAKPHLRRRLCGPCKGRVNYAERTGRTVSDLRRRAPNSGRPKRKWGKSTVGQVFNCLRCGAQFVKRGDNQKYCDAECARAADRQAASFACRCSWCDREMTRTRRNPSGFYYCKHECQWAHKRCVIDGDAARSWPRTQPCVQCGQQYPTSSTQPTRCPNCAATHRAQMMESLKVEQACQDCGEIVRAMPGMKRCSPCKRDYQRQRANARRKRRGWRAGYKHKRRQYIIERDGGRCQVCRSRVVLDDPQHPRAAEVDHIIPISMWPTGEPGLNKPNNLRLLCRTCNLAKSNGTAPGGDQLLLIG